MIKLNDITSRGLKIAQTSQYLWECFGDSVYHIDIEGLENFTIVSDFDRIFYIDVYFKDAIVVWVDPEFRQAYVDEASNRGIDIDYTYDLYEIGDMIPYISVDEKRAFDLILSASTGVSNEYWCNGNVADIDTNADSTFSVNLQLDFTLNEKNYSDVVKKIEETVSKFDNVDIKRIYVVKEF